MHHSVGGFFKSVKKLGNKVKSKISRTGAIGRSAVGIFNRAEQIAGKVGKTVVAVGRSPYFRAGLAAAATAFPVLAPAAVAVETANRIYDQIEKGKQAAEMVARGARDVGTLMTAKNGAEKAAAVGSMMKLAQKGDPRAMRFMGAVVKARPGVAIPSAPPSRIMSNVRAIAKAKPNRADRIALLQRRIQRLRAA